MKIKEKILNSIPISNIEKIEGVKLVVEPHELDALLLLLENGEILKLKIEEYDDNDTFAILYQKSKKYSDLIKLKNDDMF